MTAAEATRLIITFNQHLAAGSVASLTSQIAQYGLLHEGHPAEQVAVDIRRASKLPALKAQLSAWEREGYLRWTEQKI
jgi:hypothetical protein